MGENVAVSCNLISGQQEVLTWERSDGIDLKAIPNLRVVGTDSVSSSLLVKNARFEDAGTYTCRAGNTTKATTSLIVEGNSRLPSSSPRRSYLTLGLFTSIISGVISRAGFHLKFTTSVTEGI